METNGEGALGENRNSFGLSPFVPHNATRAGLATLILALSALAVQMFVPSALAESGAPETNGGTRRWSIQVDRVDFGDLSPDASLGAAIYANLLHDLVKTKRFKQVLRSDDRDADDVPELLILKTTVQEYAPNREIRQGAFDDVGLLGVVPEFFLRFWGRPTVRGATKLKARIRLYSRQDLLVLEGVVERDVSSTGDNSRDTRKLAHTVAVTLKMSALPEPQ